jgi:CHAT domain-containing protein
VSLGSAFLAAGVDNVVTSLWPVDRLATAVLFDDFFGRLRTGATFSGALRAAALALRALPGEALLDWAHERLPAGYAGIARRRAEASERPFSHPYFWAGFIVTGKP